MNNAAIIEIGNADKGGFWYAAPDQNIFVDGFRTDWEAAQAVMARFPRYEIYYQIWHNPSRRMMSIPGETTEN
jgi:hypothetical protein